MSNQITNLKSALQMLKKDREEVREELGEIEQFLARQVRGQSSPKITEALRRHYLIQEQDLDLTAGINATMQDIASLQE